MTFLGRRVFLGHNPARRMMLGMQSPMRCVRRPLATSRFTVAEAHAGSQLTMPPPPEFGCFFAHLSKVATR